MSLVFLVHLKVDPTIELLNPIAAILAPEHIDWVALLEIVTVGFGFKLTVNSCGKILLHPSNVKLIE